jgi:hypothetical protein
MNALLSYLQVRAGLGLEWKFDVLLKMGGQQGLDLAMDAVLKIKPKGDGWLMYCWRMKIRTV